MKQLLFSSFSLVVFLPTEELSEQKAMKWGKVEGNVFENQQPDRKIIWTFMHPFDPKGVQYEMYPYT